MLSSILQQVENVTHSLINEICLRFWDFHSFKNEVLEIFYNNDFGGGRSKNFGQKTCNCLYNRRIWVEIPFFLASLMNNPIKKCFPYLKFKLNIKRFKLIQFSNFSLFNFPYPQKFKSHFREKKINLYSIRIDEMLV